MPIATSEIPRHLLNKQGQYKPDLGHRASYTPLQSTGALDAFPFEESTPVIGREYERGVQLSEWLKAENRDDLIKELSYIVSSRNVVFFRDQDITVEEQKLLGELLGQLSGRPEASKLHVHPLTEDSSELGDEISVISSKRQGEYVKKIDESRLHSSNWHTDISFEPVPSDFAILKIHTLPPSGGDTLWASAYEAYDRLSPPYAKFLEGLTAYHEAKRFIDVAERLGNPLREGIRGHPANQGPALEANHPLIRTNPITGWKGLYVNRGFTKRINELHSDESRKTLDYLFSLFTENHDLQVRFRWKKNDLAIWSNTSTVHSATFDYPGLTRVGDRVVSLGEKPYFDPESKSRREGLGLPAWQ